jgi:hypothetical protein
MIGKISKRKINKAKSDLVLLDSQINLFINDLNNKAVLKSKYDSDKDTHQIYIYSIPDLDDFANDIAINVGEIIHNTRSSLDNLIYELALVNTNNNIEKPKRLQFPICDTIEEFQRYSENAISEISATHKSILESYQPFRGIAGRPDSWNGPYIHQLTLLREFSNTDKHRSIIEIFFDPNHFEIMNSGVVILNMHHYNISLNPMKYFNEFQPASMAIGQVVFEAKVPGLIVDDSQIAGYAIASVALEEKRPLFHTVKRIIDYVELVSNDLIAA